MRPKTSASDPKARAPVSPICPWNNNATPKLHHGGLGGFRGPRIDGWYSSTGDWRNQCSTARIPCRSGWSAWVGAPWVEKVRRTPREDASSQRTRWWVVAEQQWGYVIAAALQTLEVSTLKQKSIVVFSINNRSGVIKNPHHLWDKDEPISSDHTHACTKLGRRNKRFCCV